MLRPIYGPHVGCTVRMWPPYGAGHRLLDIADSTNAKLDQDMVKLQLTEDMTLDRKK